jgi:hypothetical protein
MLLGGVQSSVAEAGSSTVSLPSVAARFVVDGKEIVVKAGETLPIPPNAPHSAEMLEDWVTVDIFSPVREYWLRGEDAYLRG